MLGLSALNRPAYSPYRSSVLSQAAAFTRQAASPEIQPEVIIPVPDGWSFAKNADTNQLHVSVGPLYARRSKRVFGYVGEIALSAAAKGSALPTPCSFLLLLLRKFIWCFSDYPKTFSSGGGAHFL